MVTPDYLMKTTLGILAITLGQVSAASTAINIFDVYSGSVGSTPRTLVSAGGYIYFSALVPNSGRELVRADRSGFKVIELRRNGSSNPTQLTRVGNDIFFTAIDSIQGNELWKFDAQSGVASVVRDIRQGSAGSGPSYLTSINGKLMFLADDGVSGRELWESDGSRPGTRMVADINPGSGGIEQVPLTDVNGTLFFHADDQKHGRELWASDGTAIGTRMVRDINAGTNSSTMNVPATSFLMSESKRIYSFEGMAFFMAEDGSSGHELWRSDGTAVGTVQIAEINPTFAGSFPAYMAYHNGVLFFTAEDGASGRELYRTHGPIRNGLVKTELLDINPGLSLVTGVPNSSLISEMTGMNDSLYFGAKTGSDGFELMEYNISTERLNLVSDINPGARDASVRQLTVLNGKLYFSATDGKHGQELWESGGSHSTTRQVMDLYPGRRHSRPENLHVTGGDLVFSADDGVLGREIGWMH